MAYLILIPPILAFGYLAFVCVAIGMHQRLPLALGRLSLEGILDRAARKHGERPLFTTDRPCAWEVPALRGRYVDPSVWSAVRVRQTAGFLARMLRDRLGLRHGERVAILKENHLDVQVFAAAIVRAGGIACPINGKFAADKLHPYLLNIGARVLISDGTTLRRLLDEEAGFGDVERIVVAEKKAAGGADLQNLLAVRQPGIEVIWLEDALRDVWDESPAVSRGEEEPLYLVHSSGTTGFPKAVILTNGAQSHAVRGWLCYVQISRTRDRGYLAVPINHQAVILTFNSLLLLGVRVHWTRAFDRDGFDPDRVAQELAEGRFTGFFAFPLIYTQLKEVRLDRYDLSRMRFWGSTADASHEAIQRCFVAVGGVFRQIGLPLTGSIYLDAQGSSEVGTPSVLRYITRFTHRFDRRVGRPGSTPFGPLVRVANQDGTPVPPGEVGRLEVKGRTVFPAYWNNHALTYQAFRDGWFFTGDVARRESDGHIVQLDREVDVIHTTRGPIYSLPIEEKIHKHPLVFDACVYGARQGDGTQLPAAAIAVRPGGLIDAEQLRRELNDLLAEQEHLSRVQIVPWSEFPMGVTGKTLKRVFRERTEPLPPPEQNRPVFVSPPQQRSSDDGGFAPLADVTLLQS